MKILQPLGGFHESRRKLGGEIDLIEWAQMTLEAGEPQFCRVDQQLETQGRAEAEARAQRLCGHRIPVSSVEVSVFPPNAFN